MIASLLPGGARCAEHFTDTEGEGAAPDTLFPAERAVIEGVAAGRRAEFAAVRGCARRALAGLGHPPVPLLPGPHGEPGWPEGVVGSMTHCRGYRAAVVAPVGELAALGVDAEPCLPLRPGVLRTVSRARERERLGRLRPDGRAPEPAWDRLLFSAKEAVYKAWFPRVGERLGFGDVEVTFTRDRGGGRPGGSGGSFRALLLKESAVGRAAFGQELRGRWACGRGLLVTAVAVPATRESPPAPAGRGTAPL